MVLGCMVLINDSELINFIVDTRDALRRKHVSNLYIMNIDEKENENNAE